jgi:hypothetical protein
VFEELDLPQALPGFFLRFVWAAEIFSFFRKNSIAVFRFSDHEPSFRASKAVGPSSKNKFLPNVADRLYGDLPSRNGSRLYAF